MVCFDTNIVIYLANGALDESIVSDQPIVYPSILKIEALGYWDIRSGEEQKIRELLATFTEMPLSETIVNKAIQLRQYSKISLGDAIVAATALVNNCILWTANTKDYADINGLQTFSPLLKAT